MNAAFFIHHLQLKRHPEGGCYRETYRAAGMVAGNALPGGFAGARNFSTSIYYLLEQGEHSVFHKIKSDECWHFYSGQTLLIHMIDIAGHYSCTRLGDDLGAGETFKFVVTSNTWFAAEPDVDSSFCLAGCTVAPGFDFADFEIASRPELLSKFPEHSGLLKRLCP
jgi:predicted cupin superfamily sugar epimerase